jgi:acetyl-CoA synthetase
MQSRANTLPGELTDSVLAKLGFLSRPAATLDGLRAVYSAWCRRVPFDNIRKLIHVRRRDPGPLPGDDAADFFDHWMRLGAGGTCWAGNGALSCLLVSLGFDARRGLATMLTAPDLPPNHGSVTVQCEGRRYLVDASMLHGEPLELDEGLLLDERAPAAMVGRAWAVERSIRDGHWSIRWRPLHRPDAIDCRIDRFDVAAADFRALHEQTRGWSPFNYGLCLRLNRGDSVIGAGVGRRIALDGDGHIEERPLQDADRIRFLVEEIGIHEELALALPPDVPMPAPPPLSGTARGETRAARGESRAAQGKIRAAHSNVSGEDGGAVFIGLRDRLLREGIPYAQALQSFHWPQLSHFNWAHDYFDAMARDNEAPALRVVDDAGGDLTLSFAALARRSNQVANFLTAQGVGAGDRVLIMLGNEVALWETMLAAIKLGAVMIPATILLQRADIEDRLVRGRVRAVVVDRTLTKHFDGMPGAPIRISVGGAAPGFVDFDNSRGAVAAFRPAAPTPADALMLLYFTSGTAAAPKLVAHSQTSYAVGHLSTAYWIGLRRGDVHLNLSSPGWAKHAWSCFFAPWNAEATVLAYHYERFNAVALLDQLVRCRVTTFCAPPTVWRLLIQEDLRRWPVVLREVVGAGEPLNPEIIEQVRAAWGLTIRDGFGQTETTAQIGNPPGQPLKPGSMGRPLPGYDVTLLAADGTVGEEGEICLDLKRRPVGLMQAYLDDPEKTAEVMRDGYYHTGDVASRDADGYLTYVGRIDDVFKSSDYRISPFELESVLIEHPLVAEAAVVPSPDPLRLAVPKAYVVLISAAVADAATARSILEHVRGRVAPFKRIRRLEFAPLPKTISGKIRRVELRLSESGRGAHGVRRAGEFWEEDFPDLHRRGGESRESEP